MSTDDSERQPRLGRALLQAWVGYRRRLDEHLAAAGFADHGFPDGRVLRICRRTSGVTISQIGRELGITRQGASKIVANLRDRRYVTLGPSPTDAREKIVTLTARGADFLVARRKAARAVERQVRARLGSDGFDALQQLLAALGGEERPSDYLREYWGPVGDHERARGQHPASDGP